MRSWRPRTFWFSVGLAPVVWLAACGGSSSSDLFSGATFAPDPAQDGGAKAGDASFSDAQTSADAPLQSPPDAPADTAVDAAKPPTQGVECAGSTCKVPGNVCCRMSDTKFACTPDFGCTSVSVFAIPCDDAQDCEALGEPGSVCCASSVMDSMTQKPRITSIACRPAAKCPQPTGFILCDKNAKDPCPLGGECKSSGQTVFSRYDYCQ